MMNAFEFLKEYNRMCHSYDFCGSCPLWGEPCIVTGIRSLTDSEFLTITSTVEQWSKEHPLVTNEMKIREIFGDNAVNSILVLHPSDIKRWLAEPYKERES